MTTDDHAIFRFHAAHDAEAHLLAAVRGLDTAGMTETSARVMAIFEELRSARLEAERAQSTTA